jgi:predicted transcriptional regulator
MNDFPKLTITSEIYMAPELADLDRRLYILISLLDRKGGCTVTLEHFADFFDTDVSQISRSIKKLMGRGYIDVLTDKKIRKYFPTKPQASNRFKLRYGKILKNCGWYITNQDLDKNQNDTHEKRGVPYIYINKITKENKKINTLPNRKEDKSSIFSLDLSYGCKFSSETVTICSMIFKLWNSLGSPLPQHRDGTKLVDQACKQINTLLKSGVDEKQITSAIQTYHKFLTSPKKGLKNTQVGVIVGLNEFFGFSVFLRHRMHSNSPLAKEKSWFKIIQDGREKQFLMNPGDTSPEIEKMVPVMQEKFVQKFLGGIAPKVWSEKSQSQFQLGSRNLVRMMNQIRGKTLINRTSTDLVDDLMKSLHRKYPQGGIVPGHLCSKYTWEVVFPSYLVQQAIVSSSDDHILKLD